MGWEIAKSPIGRVSASISGRIRKRLIDKVSEDITISSPKQIPFQFVTGSGFPAILLMAEMDSKSEIDVHPTRIAANVKWGSNRVFKIIWDEFEITKDSPDDEVDDLPAKDKGFLKFKVPVPSHINAALNKWYLDGTVEFRCMFGTFPERILVEYYVPDKEWTDALENWKDTLKKDKTVIHEIMVRG